MEKYIVTTTVTLTKEESVKAGSPSRALVIAQKRNEQLDMAVNYDTAQIVGTEYTVAYEEEE